ncbi:extracellular solute-binding protein [Paenibacillus sp. J2TS4]|uniref:extracellular solute-binding protein n=1 Tax=Paenibacillus sp. J2TS4 TaxID=2807194 RepID=UPI001BD05928|nr:extracellular solute-binding protein [Paenibacillus sp. J2TS4]
MRRRAWCSLALSVTLTGTLLSACGGGGGGGKAERDDSILDNLNETGMPIVNEPITMKAFAGKFFASADWNNLMLWQEYEKMTNLHMEWDTVQVETLTEKRNLLLAGGDYPELLYATAVSKPDLIRYGTEGVFLPLNDLIEEYAPNFKKLMDDYPIVKKGITMPDGNIYSFPTIRDPEFMAVRTRTPWMKKEWLDNLGLQEPTTLDEFYNVLKQIKEGDPNGNGQADEIPYGALGISQLLDFLKGSFGLNNHGTANVHIDEDPETKKLRFIPADPRYKEILEYTNKLYSEGLIDKEILSLKTAEFTARASEGVYGFVSNVNPESIFNQQGYIGMPVLEGPYGDRKNTAIGSPLGNLGQFIITDKNQNPEAAVRWMDYFYSDEGARMFFMGFKDVTYKEQPSGELEYTDEIINNPKGLNLDQAVSQYLIWPGGYYPGIIKHKFFKGAEGRPSSIENTTKALPYTLKDEEIWPAFNFTTEEQDELTTIQSDLDIFIEEMRDKFITGAASFSEWDDYVQKMEKMGLERYMKIYETAYERYQKQ